MSDFDIDTILDQRNRLLESLKSAVQCALSLSGNDNSSDPLIDTSEYDALIDEVERGL